MNKIWGSLGLAVLGIAILVGAASATTIQGNVQGSFEISATPNDQTSFSLTPSTSTAATCTGTLSVNANKGWTVTASADSVTGSHTKGYMSKYSSSAYSSPETKLTNAMEIMSDDTEYDTLAALTSDQAIAVGTGIESHTVTFSQLVSWGDTILTGSDKYQIVVTYSIA